MEKKLSDSKQQNWFDNKKDNSQLDSPVELEL